MRNYNDHLLPSRLGGRVRENRMLLSYVVTMLKTKDAGLKLALSERYAQLETERAQLEEEARVALASDNAEAAMAAGGQ